MSESPELCFNMVSFEWRIENLFSVNEINKCWESPEFSLSGKKCYLEFYPNGTVETQRWVSVYLTISEWLSTKPRITYMIGIQKMDGSIFKSFSGISESQEFYGAFGKKKFLKISELRASKDILTEDDSLTLVCLARDCSLVPINISSVTECDASDDSSLKDSGEEISRKKRKVVKEEIDTDEYDQPALQDSNNSEANGSVNGEGSTSSFKTQCSQSSLQILQQNLKELFTSGHGGDVTFKVQDEGFLAHRLILSARSTEFFKMFNQDTEEKKTGIVNIDNFSSETFKDFLFFVYTSDLEVVSSSNAVELYKIADKYNFKDLCVACVQRMSEALSPEIFCDIILLATIHNESKLLKTATDFFVKNYEVIFLTDKWQLLMKEHTPVANELLIKMSKSK